MNEEPVDNIAPLQECHSIADFQALLDASESRPVFLYKHSTACGISAWAQIQFTRFAEQDNRPLYARILVLERRELSDLIAEKTGIRHQSPQVIALRHGRAVAALSRREISKMALTSLLVRIIENSPL